MKSLLDDFLVGVLLMAAFGYAVFSLGPRTLRGRSLAAVAAVLSRVPLGFGLRTMASRLSAAAAIKPKGGCGGCDSCGSEQPAASGEAGGEVRIPISKIPRRS